MYKEELIELLSKEIQKFKDSGKEINLMVSGGVDSSTLLGIIHHLGITPDRLISVKLPYGPAHDEFGDMLKVVKHFGYERKLCLIELEEGIFFDQLREAVRIIGRPIAHYTIWPLYVTFRDLAKEGVTDVIMGNGPDESMGGYTRHMIMVYLYGAYEKNGFKEYGGMIEKILNETSLVAYASIIGKRVSVVQKHWDANDTIVNNMCRVDMKLMRPDMADMGFSLAKHFGIEIHTPYESPAVDEYMFGLPQNMKVAGDMGKILLRIVGSSLGVPNAVIWRKHKIGGPVVPVNTLAGWDDLDPYDKSGYLKFQEKVLNEDRE